MRAKPRHLLLALTALFLITAGSDAYAQKSDDRARIAELAAQAATGEWLAQREAVATLAEDHGAFAVNGLLRWIGGLSDVESRVQAVYAMRRLGEGAVMAMVAGLHSTDPMVRRNICLVLGEVGDDRAVPALMAAAALDDDPLTQEQAQAALQKMGAGEGCPVGALVDLAARLRSGGADELLRVFFWNGKAIASREVSAALFGPAYAKLLAEDALRINPANERAQAELIGAYGAMKDAIAAGDDGVESWEEELPKITDLLALGGQFEPVKYESGFEAPPLTGASELLESGDKRLRYKAALALAGSNPAPEVVRVLADAMSESVTRQILVVAPDRNELNDLVGMLTGRKSFAVGAPTGAQGLMRAKAQPVKDAIILRTSLTDVAADQIISSLSRDIRTKDVPVIVIAEETEVGRVQAMLGDSVVAVVPGPVTLPVITPALDAAFEQATLNDQRMAAEEFSRLAAEALSTFDAATLGPANCALINAIGRDDSVQVPALYSIAKLGDAAAQIPAAKLFADGGSSSAARIAAAAALGGVLASNEALPGTIVWLAAALGGDDADLRSAAARVLGRACSVQPGDRAAMLLESGVKY